MPDGQRRAIGSSRDAAAAFDIARALNNSATPGLASRRFLDFKGTPAADGKPEKRTRQAQEAKKAAKLHPFAVLPDDLTRTFSELRDASGAYADLDPRERPTIHELRGFGMHLYEEAGDPKEYIMALSGHATDEMYDRYIRDHAQKGPKRVEAGINAGQLPAEFPQNTPKIPQSPK